MKYLREHYIVVLVILLGMIGTVEAWKPTRQFRFRNNCEQTIWVGGFGIPLMQKTGWEMKPKSE